MERPLLRPWSFQPCKRSFPPRHPFFEEGDLFCNVLTKQIFIPVNETNVYSEVIQCDLVGCKKSFLTLASYEAHYNSFHRNTCQQCRRTFPSNFLLDLHILENHDVLFKLMSNAKYTFRCLSESCPDKFSSDKERKEHLVTVHKYPADFRFNRLSRKQRKLNNRSAFEAMDTSDQNTTRTNKPENLESSTDTMDLSEPSFDRKRPPRNICFGRGSVVTFQRKPADIRKSHR